MTTESTVIDIYFDVVSPYSWIAVEALFRYEKKLPAKIQYKPFYLAGIMKATGNRPPAMVPAKGAHMVKDLQYNREYWGIPLNQPTDFFGKVLTKSTALPLRFLTALGVKYPTKIVSMSRALWERLWSKDLSIHSEDDIKEAAKTIGLTDNIIDQLLIESKTEKIKNLLKKRTDEAVDTGAYGAPWIVIRKPNDEIVTFFGSDRMPLICHQLGVEFKGSLKSKL